MPVYDNLLEQDFSAAKPNQKWVQDITYLATDEGWVYLAVVIDLYSRLVVGWAMSPTHRYVAGVSGATERSGASWETQGGVIVHSDRGSQYCAHRYRALLKQYSLVGSMSQKGCCYDNACAESFFHSLKVELIHRDRFKTRPLIRQAVFRYIEVDYNRTRRHSACGYLSPEHYERRHAA